MVWGLEADPRNVAVSHSKIIRTKLIRGRQDSDNESGDSGYFDWSGTSSPGFSSTVFHW